MKSILKGKPVGIETLPGGSFFYCNNGEKNFCGIKIKDIGQNVDAKAIIWEEFATPDNPPMLVVIEHSLEKTGFHLENASIQPSIDIENNTPKNSQIRLKPGKVIIIGNDTFILASSGSYTIKVNIKDGVIHPDLNLNKSYYVVDKWEVVLDGDGYRDVLCEFVPNPNEG